MRRTNVTHVKHIWKKKDLVSILLVIFLIMSGIIALITFYGQNVGCFSIRMSEEALRQNIYVSTDPTFETYSPRLIVDSVSEANNTTYKIINTKYVKNHNGMYVSQSKGYVGYTFYLKNMGNEAVNISSSLEIAESTKDAHKAVWLWYFFGEDDIDGTIYQAKDELPPAESGWPGYEQDYRERKEFESDTTVFKKNEMNLLPGSVQKVSVIIWFEGEDPDCTDKVVGGQLKFNLTYSLTSEGADIA